MLLNPLYERYLDLGYLSYEITSVLMGSVYGAEVGDVPGLQQADGEAK